MTKSKNQQPVVDETPVEQTTQDVEAQPANANGRVTSDGVVRNSRKGVTEADRKVYDNLEEARASRPAGKEAWSLFVVSGLQGGPRYIWDSNYSSALWNASTEAEVTIVDDLPTVDDAKDLVSKLTQSERDALLNYLRTAK
jgi:hypothetical protein